MQLCRHHIVAVPQMHTGHYIRCSILHMIIVFSASKAQKSGEAGGVRPGLGVGPRSGQIWSRLLINGQNHDLIRCRVPF